MNTELFVTYHAFGVIENGIDWPIDAPPPANGLIDPFPGGALVYTGIHTGRVTVQTVTYSEAPTDLDASADWEAIAEVTVVAKRGKVRLRSYDSDPEGPILSASGRGPYRVRAYATGRDTDIDGTASLVETYRLEIWPGAESDPITYRSEDQYGAQVMRSSNGDDEAAPEQTHGRFVDGGALDEWV